VEDLKDRILRLAGNEVEIIEITEIDPRKLNIDIRTRWKCQFGCSYYGKRYSCPPAVPPLSDAEKFIKSYSKAFAIKFRFNSEKYVEMKRKAQLFLVEVERKLINEYPFAFALFPGGCDICEECSYTRGNCKRREYVRPTVTSVGINVTSLGVEMGDETFIGILLLE
jgi:predicted metal-binding protein